MNNGLILIPNNVVVGIIKISEKTKSKVVNIYKSQIVNYVLYIVDFTDYVALISTTGEIILDVLRIEFKSLLEEFDCIKHISKSAKKIIGINATARGSIEDIVKCFAQNNINGKEVLR